MPEKIIKGWKAIAEMFDIPERTMMLRKEELKACGAIFYRLEGNPRIHKRHKIVCAFPSVLKDWMILKASQGKRF